MATNIGPKIGVDGEKEYRQQISQIIQQSKTLASEMKLVSASFTAATSAEDKNAKTAAVLNKQIATQRQYIEALAAQAGKAAATYGTNSVQAQKYEEQLNKARAKLLEMQHALQDTEHGVEDLGNEMDSGGDKAISFGDVLKANILSELVVDGLKKMADAVKGFASGMIDAAAEVKATNAQFAQTFGDLASSATKELNTIGDAAGILPSRLKSAYTQLYAYAKSSGMNSAAALKFATEATYAAADAAAYYDRSLEEATEQVLAYTKGNYANDAALGFASTEATRNAQAMKSLGKEYKDLDVTAGETTQVLLDQIVASQKLSGAYGQASREMDGWENVTGNAKEAWKQFKAAVGEPFLEALTPVLQDITTEFVAWTESVDWESFSATIASFVSSILENGEYIVSLIAGIGAGFITWNVASLINKAVTSINAFKAANEGATVAQWAINAAMNANPIGIIITLAAGLVTAIITLWNTNEDFRNGVIEIWTSIKDWISGAVKSIVSWFTTAGENIRSFFTNVGTAVSNKARDIARAVRDGVQSAINWLRELPGRAISLGSNIVKGIFNGIQNAGAWLYNKLRGWVSNVIGWVKRLFGIHSPSTVFADEIGKFIPPGITVGVKEAMPRALRDMGQELSALSNIPIPGSVTNTTHMGGVSITVYGAQGQDVNALADVIMYKMQSAVESREAVFA
nr:MAG TPA: tail tape measure protein [Caudoviricetes sp.]